MQAIEAFPRLEFVNYSGTSTLDRGSSFRDGPPNGTNTNDVQQMSQEWIKLKIQELYDEGSQKGDDVLKNLANEMKLQYLNHDLQAMVVNTKITKDGIQAPQYLMKDWDEIGTHWFDDALQGGI